MKQLLFWTIGASCLFFLGGCKNQSSSVWDDSNNMGSYKRAKERVLWGSGSEEVASSTTRSSFQEPEFLELQDDDLKEQFSDLVFAQPKNSPGEEGSILPGIDGFSLPTGALAHLFQTVYFNTDEFKPKTEASVSAIKKMGAYLKSHPNVSLFVEGFCDQRGPEAYNLALGSKRANHVRSLLIKEGASPDQVHTISYGKEQLADLRNTPEAWAKNRRAEFKIYQR